MEFLFGMTVALFAIGFWNLLIAIFGLFPQCRATAVGTLVKANTRRNVQGRHRIIPVATEYTYVYIVNGKQYKYSRGNEQRRQCLFPKKVLQYVKWFPRHAYDNKFTGEREWVLGISMLICGILCTVAILNI